MWDVATAVLKGKVIALNTYIKKNTHTNRWPQLPLETDKQMKPKISKLKKKKREDNREQEEINEIEN